MSKTDSSGAAMVDEKTAGVVVRELLMEVVLYEGVVAVVPAEELVWFSATSS